MGALAELDAQADRLLVAGDEAVAAALADLSGDARAELEGALVRGKSRAMLLASDESIEENADGTLIVRLTVPVKVGSDLVSRLTVDRLKMRHVKAGQKLPEPVEYYTDVLVRPVGAADELERELDHIAVIRAVHRQMGKYQAGGARS